jgi:transcriptional regulator with XRE-family HTH domain
MEREGTEDRARPAVRGTSSKHSVTFGATLRELRDAAGLTQEELASRAGLTAKAVSALERGERKRPYPHTVRALADALGLSDEERASLLAAVPNRGTEAAPAAAVQEQPAMPAPHTSLLGRERELEEIQGFLTEVRLMTLTGTGGWARRGWPLRPPGGRRITSPTA